MVPIQAITLGLPSHECPLQADKGEGSLRDAGIERLSWRRALGYGCRSAAPPIVNHSRETSALKLSRARTFCRPIRALPRLGRQPPSVLAHVGIHLSPAGVQR